MLRATSLRGRGGEDFDRSGHRSAVSLDGGYLPWVYTHGCDPSLLRSFPVSQKISAIERCAEGYAEKMALSVGIVKFLFF